MVPFGAKIEKPKPTDLPGEEIAPFTQTPSYLNVEMRDYQLEGLRWLAQSYENGISAILGDEMGLGKTLQTIAFLSYLKFERGVNGPHLVIAPLSVLSSWLTEFSKFCPAMRVVKLHSSDGNERERLKSELLNKAGSDAFDVVVTTYEMAKSPNMKNVLKSRTHWRYVVLDEGHVIKNEESQISQAVRGFHFQAALLLTGTPLQNNLHELYALLNFLYPTVFTVHTAKHFDNAFDLTHGKVDDNALTRAHRLLKPLMIRRLKADVEGRLPPKVI